MILSRYISVTVLLGVLMVLCGLLGLDALFRLVAQLDRVVGNYTPWVAVQYVLLGTPARIVEIFPIASLIGCLTGLGALAGTSELTVMRAAGVSTMRLVWQAIKPLFVLTIGMMLIAEYVVPSTQVMSDTLRDYARKGRSIIDTNYDGLWLRDDQQFIYANAAQPKGLMFGLRMFTFDDQHRITRMTSAKRATFTGDHWLLEDVTQQHFAIDGYTTESIQYQTHATMDWYSSIKPQLLKFVVIKPENLDMRSLWTYINFLREQNLGGKAYEMAFWEKAFYPFAVLSLIMVGVGFIFGPLRQSTMGYRIFLGVIVGITFQTLQDVVIPIGIVFMLPAIAVMAAPAVLSFTLGAWLLARVR